MAWMSRAKSGIDTAMLYNERTSWAQSANNPMMLGASIALVVWSFFQACDQKIEEKRKEKKKGKRQTVPGRRKRDKVDDLGLEITEESRDERSRDELEEEGSETPSLFANFLFLLSVSLARQ